MSFETRIDNWFQCTIDNYDALPDLDKSAASTMVHHHGWIYNILLTSACVYIPNLTHCTQHYGWYDEYTDYCTPSIRSDNLLEPLSHVMLAYSTFDRTEAKYNLSSVCRSNLSFKTFNTSRH